MYQKVFKIFNSKKKNLEEMGETRGREIEKGERLKHTQMGAVTRRNTKYGSRVQSPGVTGEQLSAEILLVTFYENIILAILSAFHLAYCYHSLLSTKCGCNAPS